MRPFLFVLIQKETKKSRLNFFLHATKATKKLNPTNSLNELFYKQISSANLLLELAPKLVLAQTVYDF